MGIQLKLIMDQTMNTSSTRGNQGTALPENNEELIRMLGLDEFADSDNEKLLDNINFDMDAFTVSSQDMMDFQDMPQGYQLIGNSRGAYQQTEIKSVPTLSPGLLTIWLMLRPLPLVLNTCKENVSVAKMGTLTTVLTLSPPSSLWPCLSLLVSL